MDYSPRKTITKAQAEKLPRPWQATFYYRSGAVQQYAIGSEDCDNLESEATHGMYEPRWVSFQTSSADTIVVNLKALSALRIQAIQEGAVDHRRGSLRVKLVNIAEEIAFPFQAEENEMFFGDEAPPLIDFFLRQSMVSLAPDKYDDEELKRMKFQGITPAAIDSMFASDELGGGLYLFPDGVEWLRVEGPLPKRKKKKEASPLEPASFVDEVASESADEQWRAPWLPPPRRPKSPKR